MQGWIPETVEDAEAFIKRTGSEINLPNTWYQLVIIEKDSGNMIGDIGLHFIGKHNKNVELGYTIAVDHQGQGFATESIEAVLEYLFTKLDKHRVIASITPGNDASVKLVERFNFRKEAHHMENYFLRDRWVDTLVYALLRREWVKDQN